MSKKQIKPSTEDVVLNDVVIKQKRASKKTTEVTEPVEATEEVVAEVDTKKKRSSKKTADVEESVDTKVEPKKRGKAVKAEPVNEDSEQPASEPKKRGRAVKVVDPEAVSEEKPKKKRASKKTTEAVPETETDVDVSEPTEVSESAEVSDKKDNIVDLFDELYAIVEHEIEEKPSNVKTMRLLKKKMASFRSKVVKAIKKKSSSKKGTVNMNSGFMKPVQISSDMSKFAGWESGVAKSRVDVTKHICNYIKEHELQNPEDKRYIKPDAKLAKLLNFDDTKDDLTYYKIQTYIKPHFIK